MSEPAGGDYLAGFASQYESRVTAVTPNGQPAQRVVTADPRRVMLRVYSRAGTVTVGALYPTVAGVTNSTAISMPAPIECKLRDCPDWTTGEWYGRGTDVDGWVVLESIFVGG